MPTQQNYSLRDVIEYTNLAGSVKYWDGMLTQACSLKNGEETRKSAANLRKAMKEYTEKVPKEIVQRTNIYLKGLETKCAEALDTEIDIKKFSDTSRDSRL